MNTSPSATPTPVTPPRVPLIDERTKLIDRAWYLFFLSLFRSAETANSAALGPSAESLIASYDDALRALTNETETQPLQPVYEVAEMHNQVQALEKQPTLETLLAQIAELQKQVEGMQVVPPPREFKRSRYGSFYNTTTLTPAAINTAYGMTFNTTDISRGVYVGSPTSRIYVDETSLYDFQFSAQIDNTSGGNHIVWIWVRRNGVDIADSAGEIAIKGNDGEVVPAWNYFIQLVEGDYVEIMYSVSDTAVQIAARPAVAPVPAIPSVILTVSNNILGVQG